MRCTIEGAEVTIGWPIIGSCDLHYFVQNAMIAVIMIVKEAPYKVPTGSIIAWV